MMICENEVYDRQDYWDDDDDSFEFNLSGDGDVIVKKTERMIPDPSYGWLKIHAMTLNVHTSTHTL